MASPERPLLLYYDDDDDDKKKKRYIEQNSLETTAACSGESFSETSSVFQKIVSVGTSAAPIRLHRPTRKEVLSRPRAPIPTPPLIILLCSSDRNHRNIVAMQPAVPRTTVARRPPAK